MSQRLGQQSRRLRLTERFATASSTAAPKGPAVVAQYKSQIILIGNVAYVLKLSGGQQLCQSGFMEASASELCVKGGQSKEPAAIRTLPRGAGGGREGDRQSNHHKRNKEEGSSKSPTEKDHDERCQ